MTTQIFDDGSTLSWSSDYGYVSSTEATFPGMSVNNSPSFPGLNSITNALTYGFGRWVDYKTRPDMPQNTVPMYANTGMQQGGIAGLFGSDLFLLLLIGGGLFMLVKD